MWNAIIEQSNSLANAWAWWMKTSILDAVIVLAVVSLLWFAIRRRASPQLGYLLFLLVPLKLFVPLEIAVPERLVSWTPVVTSRIISQPSTTAEPRSDAGHVEPPLALNRSSAPPVSPMTVRQAAPNERAVVSEPMGTPPPPDVSIGTRSTPALPAWIMLGWISGVLMLSARLVYSQVQFHRVIMRNAKPIDPGLFSVDFGGLLRRIRLGQRVRIAESESVSSPVIWGILKPMLILPSGISSSLSAGQLEWVLLHELAHVRRRDLVVRYFQCLVTIVHFANPAIWIANRMINRLREYACDDMASAFGNGSQTEQGEAFLGVIRYAASIQHRSEMNLDGAVGVFESTERASCFDRMKRLLDTNRRVTVRLGLGSICILLLTAALALPQIRATNQPTGEQSDDQAAGLESPTAASAASAKTKIINLSTGLDGSNQAFRSGGEKDAHWTVESGEKRTFVPAVTVDPSSPDWLIDWPSNNAHSGWIARTTAFKQGSPSPPYQFRRTFDLTGCDLSSVTINGSWAVDTEGALSLNGKRIAVLAPWPWAGFAELQPFSVPQSCLNQGENVLAITMSPASDNQNDGVRLEGYVISAPKSSGAHASVLSDAAADYDAGWKAGKNPNGVWTYGWSSALNSPLHVYTRKDNYRNHNPNTSFDLWNDPSELSENTPCIYKNIGAEYSDSNFEIPAGALILSGGGPSGNDYSHVVWTAPRDGRFSLDATFILRQVASWGNPLVNVYILKNGTSLFERTLNHYSDKCSNRVLLSLVADDEIDFVVGFPGIGLHGESTQLEATIADVTEPSLRQGLGKRILVDSAVGAWQDSGVDVVAGQILKVTATGKVFHQISINGGSRGYANPNGVGLYGDGTHWRGGESSGGKPQFDGRTVLPSAIAQSLVGKIEGTTALGTGTPVPEGAPGKGVGFVGSSYSQKMTTTGRLFFAFNDERNQFWDNSGSFKLAVEVVSEPSAQPSAEKNVGEQAKHLDGVSLDDTPAHEGVQSGKRNEPKPNQRPRPSIIYPNPVQRDPANRQ